MAERAQLIDDGERLLAGGDAAAAMAKFEAATLIFHAADAELLLVRAQMQAGDYRRALAFAAHAAGAHPEAPGGTALYAWLLQVGGQGRYATRLLADAIARQPAATVLLAAREQLGTDWPLATGALATGVARAAPDAHGARVPDDARVVGSAVLLPDARRAVVPIAVVAGASRLWLRNGLGQTVEATLVRQHDEIGLAELRLDEPLAAPDAWSGQARDPRAGTAGYALEYAPGPAQAAWPLLRQGFFANVARDGGARPLGLGLPSGPHGGPVFDAAGRLAGVAAVDSTGHPRLLPITAWVEADEAHDGTRPVPMGVDELYEHGLRVALQVIVHEPAIDSSPRAGSVSPD